MDVVCLRSFEVCCLQSTCPLALKKHKKSNIQGRQIFENAFYLHLLV